MELNGEITTLMSDIIGARNILNRLIGDAVLKGIDLDIHLIPCFIAGGPKHNDDYAGHSIVECLPTFKGRTLDDIENPKRKDI